MIATFTRALTLGLLLFPLRCLLGDGPNLDPHSDAQSLSITSCMSTACHGSNVPDARKWQRAGKIWFDTDPHARAYTSLLTEASAKIVSSLAMKELKPTSQAYRDLLNAKCIACHSNESVPESQRVLGVDCQVCHGSADAWGSEHYSSEWKSLGERRFDNTSRINLESMAGCACVCASCHVGELNRTSGLSVGRDREVDHRLMAAGHPPMHFDFESYYRRYPVHWDSQDEQVGLGSATGMERWRIGKLTTTIAKLQQLTSRAKRSTSRSVTDTDWPELSEYSCTSCHHLLAQPNWRQGRSTPRLAIWDDWTVSQLECAVRDQSIAELQSRISQLKKSVEQVSPEPAQVASDAATLKGWLESELDQITSPSENSVEIMQLKFKARLTSVDQLESWESATQWYIATRVLAEGIGIAGAKAPVSFVPKDPFVNAAVWLPISNNELATPRTFHPSMLKDYINDCKQQLRTGP